MSAYIVIRVDVRDREAYGEYMRHTPRLIKKYGGRFIVRGGESVTLEGDEETLRLVVIEFASLDDAKNFYHSSDYQEVKKLREGGGEAQFVAVDGYPVEEWDAAVEESEKIEL